MSDIDTQASSIFHRMGGPLQEETSGGDTRVFVVPKTEAGGDPTELIIMGCLRVTSVRIGNTMLPPKIEYDAPDSVQFTKKLHVSIPAYDVSRNYLGQAVLRRNPMSNDGLWQAGQKVYVVGEWEDDKASTTKQKAAA